MNLERRGDVMRRWSQTERTILGLGPAPSRAWRLAGLMAYDAAIVAGVLVALTFASWGGWWALAGAFQIVMLWRMDRVWR